METGFRRRVYIAIMYCRVGGGAAEHLRYDPELCLRYSILHACHTRNLEPQY